MARKTLCKADITRYARPELEMLKALFSSLNLKASVAAIDFTETIFETELNRAFNAGATDETCEKFSTVWKV